MGTSSAPYVRPKRRRLGEDGIKGDAIRDGLYHCDYCHKDLSTSLRIKCAVCPDFDLCLECFSAGAEITPHSKAHAYRVVDNLSFPVYTLDWGADQEMLLLEAVELYGVGNWAKVGEHVGKPPRDCRTHYFSVYIETDSFPLPQAAPEMQGIDINALIEERRRAGAERIALARLNGRPGSGLASSGTAKRNAQPGPRPKSAEAGTQSVDGVKEDDEGEEGTGVVGQPKRQKHEIVSAAATPVVRLSAIDSVIQAAPPSQGMNKQADTKAKAKATTPGDPTATLASEAQQTGYHVKRNEFEPEYDPEAEHLIAELDFLEDEPEEERQKKLRLIEIYNRRLDERERRRAFVLSRGLINVKRQQAIDRRRAPSERELLARLRVLGRYLPQAQWEALVDGVAAEGRLRARISQLQHYRGMGMRTFDEVEAFEAVESKKKKEAPPAQQAGKPRWQRIPVDEAALEAELAAMGNSYAAVGVHAQHATVLEGRGPEGLQAWRARRGILLDVAALPEVGHLSAEEQALCATERYLPAQYLAIKAEILQMQETRGWVEMQDILDLHFLVEPARSARLYEFFAEAGWVKEKA